MSIRKINDDTIYNLYKPGIVLSAKDAEEIDNVHLTIAQGNDMFIIADFSQGDVSFDRSAEEFFMNKGHMIPYTRAIGIISNPKKQSLFSKLFRRNKTWYPFKEFDSVESAEKWFEALRAEEKV